MKKVCLFFLVFNIGFLAAQNNFYRYNSIPVSIAGQPLTNSFAGGINAGLLSNIDLNGDGIQDLFIFDGTNDRVTTFINNGTANTVDYHYAPQYETDFPAMKKWAFLKDYNCDGKADIFCRSDSLGSICLYRNDYSVANGLQFTLITNVIPATVAGNPDKVRCSNLGDTYTRFEDVDGDGDIDALGWPDPANGRVAYYQNKAFELSLPCDSLAFELVSLCWGKFQLALGSNSVSAFGIVCAPPMQQPLDMEKSAPGTDETIDLLNSKLDPLTEGGLSPLVAKRDDTVSSLFPLDIDADGDMDLLVGDVGSPRALLVLNGGTATQALMVSQDTIFPNYNIPIDIHSYLNFAYIDVDNDGRKDILATANRESVNNCISYYKDTSTALVPVFNYMQDDVIQNSMIDLGQGAFPSFFDYNGDGLEDLIVGNNNYAPNYNGVRVGLALFKNIGSTGSPQYDLIDRNYADFNAVANGINGFACAPAFGDLDGDGDKDMVVGTENGRLFYYQNNPVGAVADFTLNNPFLDSIDVGNYSMPCIVDLNKDGLLDLVVGKRNGRINYYQNAGTATSPDFPKLATNDTLGKVVLLTNANGVTGYTAPSFYDDNGKLKMIIGDERGDMLVYDSIDNNLSGKWNLSKTIFTAVEGRNTAPALYDLNADGLIDFVVGNSAGGLGVYYQVNPNGINNHSLKEFVDFQIMPNPANSEVTIKMDSEYWSQNLKLNIYDMYGKQMLSQDISQNLKIPISNYANGVYIIQLQNSVYENNKRLVVLH